MNSDRKHRTIAGLEDSPGGNNIRIVDNDEGSPFGRNKDEGTAMTRFANDNSRLKDGSNMHDKPGQQMLKKSPRINTNDLVQENSIQHNNTPPRTAGNNVKRRSL